MMVERTEPVQKVEEDFYEWEERDENTPFLAHMVAGKLLLIEKDRSLEW